jgi:hypothetical protein
VGSFEVGDGVALTLPGRLSRMVASSSWVEVNSESAGSILFGASGRSSTAVSLPEEQIADDEGVTAAGSVEEDEAGSEAG